MKMVKKFLVKLFMFNCFLCQALVGKSFACVDIDIECKIISISANIKGGDYLQISLNPGYQKRFCSNISPNVNRK